MSFLKGKESTSLSYPKWYEDLMRNTAALGARAASVGPMLYKGPTVAALSPGETAARNNVNAMLAAFGLGGGGGGYLPQAQDFGGGVRGFSPWPVMQGAMEAMPDWQRQLYWGLWGPEGAFAKAAGTYAGAPPVSGGGAGGGAVGDENSGTGLADAGGPGANNGYYSGDGYSVPGEFDFGGNVGGYAP